jgi:hypothetical protein
MLIIKPYLPSLGSADHTSWTISEDVVTGGLEPVPSSQLMPGPSQLVSTPRQIFLQQPQPLQLSFQFDIGLGTNIIYLYFCFG